MIGSHQGRKFLHWNMRDTNYGFSAISHRFQVLGGRPTTIDDSKKVDLSRLLIDIYGKSYIGHPRLESLIKLNAMAPKDFMTGAEEAEAFEKHEYYKLHQSTLRKVDVLANIAQLAMDNALKTNATYWIRNGGLARQAIFWLRESKLLHAIASIVAIAGFMYTIWGAKL